jgi:hypothetical protein
MKPLHFAKKGSLLDVWEKFFIFKETKTGNQINDKLSVQYNPIFDTVLQQKPTESNSNLLGRGLLGKPADGNTISRSLVRQ